MKYLDEIEIISNNYEKAGIPKGTRGTIIMPEIRDLSFECELNCLVEIHPIKICDMKVTKVSNISDKIILNALPSNNPKWWCKVEDGFVKNLLGEKKNQIPFEYES